VVVLVAGGRGSRVGAGLPKQYLPLAGQPLIRHTIINLQQALPDVVIQPVISADDVALFEAATDGLNGLSPPVVGGATRQDSVWAGLIALADREPDAVMIHDAARPFVKAAVTQRLLAALSNPDITGALPGLAVADTLKKAPGGLISDTIPRDDLFRVQTPQLVRYATLVQAHRYAQQNNIEATDDIALIEALGGKCVVVEGADEMFKVTTANDLQRADATVMLALGDIRVGNGFDVHRFEDGDGVILGGIKIPYPRKLKGHSDADVLLHALTDAIYSALGDGDIGYHFPPSDQQWKGAASDIFLKHALARMHVRGGVISSLNAVIIAEKPKVSGFREKIRENIAELAQISVDRISITATTTEKLGFTGRGEGIAVQASATLRLPFAGGA